MSVTEANPAPAPAADRDLRLDLFRGIALWLIFLDHIPSNIVSWVTIRNYGFSDATEIFIFISGFTAAFVYGRAMRDRGFIVAGARILKRAWQIYVAHVFLFMIYLAEIAYVARGFKNPLYAEEAGILDFLQQPDVTIIEALLLKFKPSNMDVLPLYIVLLILFPPILWLLQRKPTIALMVSAALYAAVWEYGWNLPAYPSGHWYFNPFAWQLLFVFGAWCALGGSDRLSGLLRSKITIAVALLYLLFAFCVTLTWHFPRLEYWLMPKWLSEHIYPIDKTNLDVLRFAHFLALAAVTVHFIPRDWPYLSSKYLRPAIICGQHSLEIFCFGVFLAFAAHFAKVEISGGVAMQIAVSVLGILAMIAVAGLISWYKEIEGRKPGGRAKSAGRRPRRRRGMTGPLTRTFALFLALSVVPVPNTHAQEVESCDVPSYFVATDATLKHVETAVKETKRLDIAVLGTGSSALAGSEWAGKAYPARLQAALERRLPGVTVNVVSQAKMRQTTADMAKALDKLLIDVKPALVLWQTGTVDAIQGVNPEEFRSTLDDGVETAQAGNADVILINMQYSPRTESMIHLSAYVDNMRVVARDRDVPLFDRLGLMRYWADNGAFDFYAATKDNAVVTRVHDCVGRALAALVIEAAHLDKHQKAGQ